MSWLNESWHTIIVGRGGGSIEDLWAFNEKIVAEAIFNCNTPIISAVGHETDTTIADYVSDRRAPTPSAAAGVWVFDYMEFENKLQNYRKMLTTYEEHLLKNTNYLLESGNSIQMYSLRICCLQESNIYLTCRCILQIVFILFWIVENICFRYTQ